TGAFLLAFPVSTAGAASDDEPEITATARRPQPEVRAPADLGPLGTAPRDRARRGPLDQESPSESLPWFTAWWTSLASGGGTSPGRGTAAAYAEFASERSASDGGRVKLQLQDWNVLSTSFVAGELDAPLSDSVEPELLVLGRSAALDGAYLRSSLYP